MLPLYKYIQKPSLVVLGIVIRLWRFFPDRLYIKLLYRLKMGRRLDLNNPQRYTEKIQWLKLYDHRPIYTTIVDKFEVKKYVANIIGEQYIIPTIGIWDNPESIEWNTLPNKFVLKTTNGGGGAGVIVCKDKSKLDIHQAIIKLNNSLRFNIYGHLREWPYRNVFPQIIAEQYMEDESGELRDYKFYCFSGEPKVMLLASNRFSDHNFNYYDMQFNPLPIHSALGSKSEIDFEKPEAFEDMIELSRRLSEGYAHVRVDLYYVNHKIYFGELTLYDSSGYDNLSSDDEDLRWGTWLDLPIVKQ